nr:immunoglobulin light chain junction region [Macaca mulatta]MOX69473.1 immunoglobulin light chain junction region [Macaca mulatta]MOX69783.1 immunoglobulin light chain junction region [Macaca mulatta]MOX69912.1 immunoglobulin light chain junction region [Macaca mulatta]MOX70570.1 immunoglobulin light chain junction region [Macaca mulatta]
EYYCQSYDNSLSVLF